MVIKLRPAYKDAIVMIGKRRFNGKTVKPHRYKYYYKNGFKELFYIDDEK